VTENSRRARYYEATSAGRAYLRAETKRWLKYAELVTALLTTSGPAKSSA